MLPVVQQPTTRFYAGLCATAVLCYGSYAMCRVPLMPLYARELGATPTMIGVVMGASTVVGILVKLPAGAWSDVVGRRPMLVAGALVFAVLPFIYLWVTSLAVLVAVRALHGSASAIFGPVASASLSDAAPAGRRATWLSTYATFQGAGQALGPIAAGYLIAAGSYAYAFLAAGLLAAATPLLVRQLPFDAPPPGAPARHRVADAVREVFRHPLILLTSLTQAAQFVQHGALSAFLPLYAHDRLGLAPSALGWLFAVQILTTVLARPVMGIICDRVGRPVLIVSGLIVSSVAVVSVSMAASAAVLTGSIAVYALGVAITSSATSAYITDLSRRARYGTAHGLFGSIYDIGDAAGPLVGGVIVAIAGYEPMFRLAGLTGLAAAGVFAFGVTWRVRPT